MLSAHQSILVSRESQRRWEPVPPSGSLEKKEWDNRLDDEGNDPLKKIRPAGFMKVGFADSVPARPD